MCFSLAEAHRLATEVPVVPVGYAPRTIMCRVARKRYDMRTLPGYPAGYVSGGIDQKRFVRHFQYPRTLP